MERRRFIKTMLVLAGGTMLPVSALKAKEWKTVIWGQKPFPTPDALRRVQTRRLLLYIEENVKKLMASFYMEPVDQVTRDAMIKLTNSLCLKVKQQGVRIYDYNTICDVRNNTPEMVDKHEVMLDLYIKLSPAEEPIRMRFHLIPGAINTAKGLV